MREYCGMAVESRLVELRTFSASNACFARDEPLSNRVGGVGRSRKPPKLRSWRCTQPRAAKATARVAVVGKMTSIPALLPSYDTRCWRAELRMRHADLRRESAAVIAAKPASALLYGVTAVWYLVWVCGCVGVYFVVG